MRVNIRTAQANAEPTDPRFYVTVFDPSDNAGNGRLRLALGPFATKDAAQGRVEEVRDYCYKADPWTHFLAFGVTAFEAKAAAGFMTPPLNAVLGTA